MDQYLKHTKLVDWQDPAVLGLANELSYNQSALETIDNCFRWVRDEVSHSFDANINRVTARASEVLKFRTGICYAESILLAALLRANRIPAGFGYQRLALDESGNSFCLHGFNFVWIDSFGCHPLDGRGNREGISTTFEPPKISLAFPADNPGETTYDQILAEPLPQVTTSLKIATDIFELEAQLPDWNE